MRWNLAQAVDLSREWINVKAGTAERSGPVGRGEVIEARAVATLRRYSSPSK
jgi:2C-methyl-D-erythritol 2,4-cyclodiphosphate synthase